MWRIHWRIPLKFAHRHIYIYIYIRRIPWRTWSENRSFTKMFVRARAPWTIWSDAACDTAQEHSRKHDQHANRATSPTAHTWRTWRCGSKSVLEAPGPFSRGAYPWRIWLAGAGGWTLWFSKLLRCWEGGLGEGRVAAYQRVQGSRALDAWWFGCM